MRRLRIAVLVTIAIIVGVAALTAAALSYALSTDRGNDFV